MDYAKFTQLSGRFLRLTKMMKILTRFLALALLCPLLLAGGAAAAPAAGIDLQTLPSYIDRLIVPAMPQTETTIAIGTLAFDTIVDVPAGFHVRTYHGGIVVTPSASATAGYARVRAGGRELTLTLISLVPYVQAKSGYRIGTYVEAQPEGFIPLTSANASLWVSDHYRLRDFQCKLDGNSKVLVLRPEALVKLEILQHELESEGVSFDRFTVMSGYRTPYYNAKIGNETSRSRHLYGDAMDVYVDANRDGKMDDINRDGRIDTADARYLLGIAERIDNSLEWGWLKGGAGVYHANAAHGPYLHVDARGYVARWGDIAASGRTGTVRTASAR